MKMNDKSIRYVYEEQVHNCNAANEVVPFILQLLRCKSVVDVGCGIGTWLKIFEVNGVSDILGIDGDNVDKSLLKIDVDKFIDYDLETFFKSEKKFDLAISLEVAEHLSLDSADIFIKTVANLSDTVLFSAAVPNQGGQNHINEQEPKYWIEKFEKLGYRLFDILRPAFWNNVKVDSWYRQNMLLFTKDINLYVKLESLENFSGKHLIHPELSKEKDDNLKYLKYQFDRINEGNKDGSFYLGLFYKFLKRKLR